MKIEYWLFLSLGLILIGGLLSCAKKPTPPPIYAPQEEIDPPDEPDSSTQRARPDPNEAILPLDPPFWTIYFAFNEYATKEMEKLASLAGYLRKTGFSVHLSGYASEEGADDYNLMLGVKRCATVRGYLEAWDVSPGRISWTSYGEENPITHDPDQFWKNRRVEVQIQGVEK